MNIIKKYIVSGIVTIHCSFVFTQPAAEAGVDSLFDQYNHSAGCVAAVIKDGEILLNKAYGYANLDYNIPLTDSSVFNIASVSKHFTAACAAILIQNGLLSSDDDINRYIPELKRFSDTIRIRHLIHHSSGIWPYEQLLFIGCFNLGNYIDNEDVVRWINHQDTLMFEPGSKFSYCNSGYVLLAKVIERVSGKSLNEFATEHLFTPCGMTNTFYYDRREIIVPNRAVSYEEREGEVIRFPDNHVVYGDGGLFTSLSDLIKWHICLFHNELKTKNILEFMLRTDTLNNGEKNNYAFGLYEGSYKGNRFISHAGFIHGFRTNMFYYPEDKLSVLFLANLSSVNSHDAVQKLSDLYLTKINRSESLKKQQSQDNVTIPADESGLKDYPGIYHWDLFNTDYHIFKKDSCLMIKRGDYDPAELKFIEKNKAVFYFQNLPFHIIFQPDKKGAIQNITVKSVRDVEIVFYKKN